MNDIRAGLRLLRKSPIFALTAILSLAIGIGANTAILSVVNTILLRPLPYANPHELAIVWENDRLRGSEQERASYPDFADLRASARSFTSLAAWQDLTVTITGDGEPMRAIAARVSPSYFDLLGIRPRLGRTFTADNEKLPHSHVALLSSDLWQRRFGSDPRIVGKALQMEGEVFSIIGVMPSDARIPANREDIWIPLAPGPTDVFRGMHNYRIYGRLHTALEQANAEIAALMRGLEAAYPNDNQGRNARVIALHEDLTGATRSPLLVLLSAVGFVLLIACVNVANLLLARTAGRVRELSIRTALGAGRWRIARQILFENVPIAVFGGVFGILLAMWGVDLLRFYGPRNLPRLELARLDLQMIAAVFGLTALTWIVFSLAPALRSIQPEPRSSVTPHSAARLRKTLVAAEIALSVMLLAGAGLLLRSFSRLLAVDPGYDTHNLLTMSVQLPNARYPMPRKWPLLDWPQGRRFQDELMRRIRETPGVESTALSLSAPFKATWSTRMTIAGRLAPSPGKRDEVHFRPVSETYFDTIRLPLKSGRGFESADDERHPLIAIVNESFARKYFESEKPIRQRVDIYGAMREIVGVAGNERFQALTRPSPPAVYLPFRQNPLNGITITVRTSADPLMMAQTLQKQIWSIDPELAVFDVITAEQALSDTMAQRRFTMVLLAGFALTALVLAAIGVYGVVAWTTEQRTKEIGIRLALGASRATLGAMVLRQGVSLSIAGTAIGSAAAFALSRVLESQLYGINPRDLTTFIAVVLIAPVAAFAAALLPARRATRIDPMNALRYE